MQVEKLQGSQLQGSGENSLRPTCSQEFLYSSADQGRPSASIGLDVETHWGCWAAPEEANWLGSLLGTLAEFTRLVPSALAG